MRASLLVDFFASLLADFFPVHSKYRSVLAASENLWWQARGQAFMWIKNGGEKEEGNFTTHESSSLFAYFIFFFFGVGGGGG